jgi:hypothetical protein
VASDADSSDVAHPPSPHGTSPARTYNPTAGDGHSEMGSWADKIVDSRS